MKLQSAMIRPLWLLVFLCLVVPLAGSGCGRKHKPRLAVQPVSGKVLVDDKPADGEEIYFNPIAPIEGLTSNPIAAHCQGRLVSGRHVRRARRIAPRRLRRDDPVADAHHRSRRRSPGRGPIEGALQRSTTPGSENQRTGRTARRAPVATEIKLTPASHNRPSHRSFIDRTRR